MAKSLRFRSAHGKFARTQTTSMPLFRTLFRQVIQDHRRNPLVRAVAKVSREIYDAHERPGYAGSGGELRLIRTLAAAGGSWRMVFDVGANHGLWTRDALPVFPDAQFHLFEIAPPTAEHAIQLVGREKRVHIHTFGLSNSSGPRTLNYYGASFDELSTLGTPIVGHPGDYAPLQVEVKTGDSFLNEQRIDTIDYLKVDAEGSDFQVLQGFSDSLTRGAIRALQFEHTGGPATLCDCHKFLTGRGYRVGKLYSQYVEFFDYEPYREDFPGPNYVAIHQSEPALIAAAAAGFRR